MCTEMDGHCVKQNKADTEHFFSHVETNNQALVAPASNSSYSGGRDQEDHSSKPA
jgi:hypothetical protein